MGEGVVGWSEFLHGRYGYYFKCAACYGNTRIDALIDTRVSAPPSSNDDASRAARCGRIRKAGREFFLVDDATGDERLVFRNRE